MKTKSKNILSLVMVIILIFAFFVILYKNIIETIQTNLSITIEEHKSEQFDDIWECIIELNDQAKIEVSSISSNIERDILSLSDSDLNSIKHDMDDDQFNKVYHDILLKNISDYAFNGIDNHQNGIIIMNMKGYVEDFNYRRTQRFSEPGSYRSWEYVLKNAYNIELEKDCMDKIINRTNGIIASESYVVNPPKNHKLISEFTYSSLLEVYLDEGIDGLKNYQIFVPYYITNLGDIFGNLDINHGVKQQNHKIIVVLEFNLYEQLENIAEKNSENNEFNNLIYRYNTLMRWMYIFGIAIVIGVIILSLHLCSVYNSLILMEENNEDDDEENVEEKE